MRAITIIAYLLCVAAMVVAEFVSRRRAERVTPVGTLLDRVMVSRPVRITIFAFWWWLGWHFLMNT
jgi:hypothetical protein